MAGTAFGPMNIIVNQTDTTLSFPVGQGVDSEIRLLAFGSTMYWLHDFDLSKAKFLIYKTEIMVAPTSKRSENYIVEGILKCLAQCLAQAKVRKRSPWCGVVIIIIQDIVSGERNR